MCTYCICTLRYRFCHVNSWISLLRVFSTTVPCLSILKPFQPYCKLGITYYYHTIIYFRSELQLVTIHRRPKWHPVFQLLLYTNLPPHNMLSSQVFNILCNQDSGKDNHPFFLLVFYCLPVNTLENGLLFIKMNTNTPI